MAYRLWNQISSIKYLKHGTFRTYSSLGDRPQSAFSKKSKKQQAWFLQSSSVSGIRNLSESKDSSSYFDSPEGVKQGRFVRTTPGPISPSDAMMRPALRYRVHAGVKRVSKMAQTHYQRSRNIATSYRLREGSDATAHDDRIKILKRAYARKVRVARLQPHSLVPFCSKNAEKFEREDLRPHRFVVDRVKLPDEYIAYPRSNEKAKEVVLLTPNTEDSISTKSDISNTSTISSAATTNSEVPSTSQSVAIKPAMAQSNHIGYNFTKFGSGTRQFSTFLQGTINQSNGIADILQKGNVTQTRLRRKERDPNNPRFRPEDCKDMKAPTRDVKKKSIYKHKGRWDKCECCPEMLDCDETEYYNEYRFPCPCDDYPKICPIDCLPPCEKPPPPKIPLIFKKQRLYQKVKECKPGCTPQTTSYCQSKTLPRMPCGNCPCVEPYVPPILPPMRFVKKRTYQCLPCPPPPCKRSCVDCVVPPKCLPPIIPGDCPCIEPTFTDVPPLKRLNLNPIQQVKECKPPCVVEIDDVKCTERKVLPPIKSDCYCIEPKPLKEVRLIRLPKMCVCPPPPDPKCPPPPCPLRADDACKWEFPKKKLKNYWCPNCKIPAKKRRFCYIHTRGQKIAKRRMSNMASLRFCKGCQSMCMAEHTYTVRDFSTLKDDGMLMAAGPSTQAKLATLFGVSRLEPLKITNAFPQISLRQFHTTVKNDIHRKLKREQRKKGICRKVKCKKFKTVCCPPRVRCTCDKKLCPPTCKPRKSPYPAFSECGEFHELLTCECKKVMPYLQPKTPFLNLKSVILKEPVPKHRVIDPLLEEHCMLADLCRPFGHTYTCENFHDGEVIPLTQYECFSPHRLPCCERDQICDFHRRPLEKTCEGFSKAPTFYRCECNCPKRKHCAKHKKYKLASMYSKIKKRTGRNYYSTLACSPRSFNIENNSIKPNTIAISSRAYSSKSSKVGGHTGRPKCPKICDKGKKKKKCGKPMNRTGIIALKNAFKKKQDKSALARQIKEHFQRGVECHEPRGNRKVMLEKAKCAARAIGMKLVQDHSDCCKHKEKCAVEGGRGGKGSCCGGLPETKRPKRVCPTCKPRWEPFQCKKIKHECPSCCMPYRITGAEFRAMQPACCKMPIPPCNRKCMRVRGDCSKEYCPCCVIESPYPSFSDCHPPFKRLIRCEQQWQEWLEDRARRKITNMLKPNNLAKTNLLRNYCTAAHINPTILDKILSCLERKDEAKGLHEPVNCNCEKCCSLKQNGFRDIKPDLRRYIKSALPSISGTDGICNIPEALFTKDDIFTEVDKENLISLAPKAMTPLNKLKCYLFNKANRVEEHAIKVPVDGFECFVSSGAPTVPGKNITGTRSSRNYSVTKAEVEEIKETVEETRKEMAEAQIRMKSQPPEVVVVSEPTDLFYLTDGGDKVINLRPKLTPASKVKVIPHPVCTHIMLDSGELMLEHEYHLMNTIFPLKDRKYLPFGLSHEEFLALEKKSIKTVQDELEKVFHQNA